MLRLLPMIFQNVVNLLPIKKGTAGSSFFTEILSRMITSHHVRGYLLYNCLRRSDHINTGYDWKV